MHDIIRFPFLFTACKKIYKHYFNFIEYYVWNSYKGIFSLTIKNTLHILWNNRKTLQKNYYILNDNTHEETHRKKSNYFFMTKVKKINCINFFSKKVLWKTEFSLLTATFYVKYFKEKYISLVYNLKFIALSFFFLKI